MSGAVIGAPRSVDFLVAALVATFVAGVYGLLLGPGRDASVFLLVGDRLLSGDLPYRDLWDHKPPAIYALTALASALPGPAWVGDVLVSVIALGVSGMLLARLTDRATALLAVFALSLPVVSDGGGLTETFAAAPALVAFLATRDRRGLTTGAAAMLALLLSLQLVAVLPALLYLIAPRWRALPSAIAGAVAVAAVPFVFLAAAGAIPDAIDALIGYQRAYLGLEVGDESLLFAVIAAFTLAPLVALAVIGGRSRSRERIGAAIWLLGAGLLLLVSARLFPHYLAFVIPPLAVVAGAGTRRLRTSARWAVPLLAAVAIAWGVVITPVASDTGERVAHQRLGAAVAEHSAPGDRIWVWGPSAATYVAADRAPASRYFYLWPLVTPGYTTPELVAGVLDELRAEPPAVIVDEVAASPYWDGADDLLRPPPPDTGGGRELDLMDPVRDWVRERYVLVEEVAGRKVYALQS